MLTACLPFNGLNAVMEHPTTLQPIEKNVFSIYRIQVNHRHELIKQLWMPSAMQDLAMALIRQKELGVLATVGAGLPHTSLMTYACSDSGCELFLVTARDTRKFQNMNENPQVSFLVDNREDAFPQSIRAVTISGTAREIVDTAQKASIREKFVASHSHLNGLFEQPDPAFFAIRIAALELLDGVLEAHYFELNNIAPD